MPDENVNNDGAEVVAIRIVCPACGERTELTPEQARLFASGLQAAASGLWIEEDLEVRGGGG
jgi:hypothetical protein